MSIFEVNVQKVFVKEHPNANLLEILNIGHENGWQVIVRKGIHKTGDLVAYIPEGGVVPEWLLKQYGYWDEAKNKGILAGKLGNRVKAKKLRDAFSLGIVIPTLKNGMGDYVWLDTSGKHDEEQGCYVLEGQNVADILEVTKYEPPIPTQLAGDVFFASTLVGVNYDVEDFKNYPDVLQEGEEVQVSVKLHGCADYDTIIDTLEFGQIKIGIVVEEKLEAHVKSFDIDSNEIIYSQIRGHQIYPNDKQWYELQTEDGNIIKLTENHLVWLPELKCYREVKNLELGDSFLISENMQ